MKRIPVGKNDFALVDDEDYLLVSQYKWYFHVRGYASCYVGNNKKVLMHRLIMQPLVIEVIDHINGNKLDNQRKNLRACTQQNNVRNNKLSILSTSGVKGVSKRNYGGWRAYITVDYKQISLGVYSRKIDAINARRKAEAYYFGKFMNISSSKEV